jgi:hypothetical protein
MFEPTFLPGRIGKPDQSKAKTGDPEALARRVKGWVEEYEFLFKAQQDRLARIESYWFRWHSNSKRILRGQGQERHGRAETPTRKPWQHDLRSPWGAINERNRTAAMVNIISETSPRFAVRGRNLDDLEGELPLEGLVDFELAVLNPVAEWVDEMFNRANVQGIAPMKARWLRESYTINMAPREWDRVRFTQALSAARDVIEQLRAQGDQEAQDPPGLEQVDMSDIRATGEQLRAFSQWTQQMRDRYGVQVPEPPMARDVRVNQHVGIKMIHVDPADITYDPDVRSRRHPPRIYQRLVTDKAAYLEFAKRENEQAKADGRPGPFDLAAIESLSPGIVSSMAGTGQFSGVADLQKQIYEVLGVGMDFESHPGWQNAIEVVEVWEPGAHDEYAWCHIGQRAKPLTAAGYYPLPARVSPFVFHLHEPTPGMLLGKSAYDWEAERHDHLDTMESLLADAVTVEVGQPLIRTGGTGVAGRRFEWQPFEIIDGDEEGQVTTLFQLGQRIEAISSYLQYAKQSVDHAQGMSDVSRGADVRLNRVGVGEVQLRAQQQQNRPRSEMYRFAAMCGRDLIPLVVLQCWHFGRPEDVLNAAGGDPFKSREMLAAENLVPGLQANYMTMPAALIAEAGLAVQLLQQTIETGGKTGLLVPAGKALRWIFGALLRLQRVQGGEQVLALVKSDLDEQEQKQGLAAQLQQAQQEAQAAAQSTQALAKENAALRRQLQLPDYQTMQAQIDAINAAAAPPEGEQQAPPAGGAPPPEPGQEVV